MADLETPGANALEGRTPGMSRRSFFEHASLASAAATLGLIALADTARAYADQPNPGRDPIKDVTATSGDVDIISAAAIAGRSRECTSTEQQRIRKNTLPYQHQPGGYRFTSVRRQGACAGGGI